MATRRLYFTTQLVLLLFFLLPSHSLNSSANCSGPAAALNSTLSDRFDTCIGRETLPLLNCPRPSLCERNSTDHGRIGLAFGLSVTAAMATAVGALLPLVPYIRQSDSRPLTAFLGLSVGVLLYISFAEILDEGRGYLCCMVTARYVSLATVGTYFAGIFLAFLLDLLLCLFARVHQSCSGWCCREVLCCPRRRRRRRENTSTRSHQQSEGGGMQIPLNSTLPSSNGAATHIQSDVGNLIDASPLDRTSVSSSNGSGNLHNYSLPDNDRHIERRSISAASNAISSGTNHIGDASIQDLLSNTSIHRLNTVVLESVSASGEACSHVSLSLMNEDGSLRTAPGQTTNGEVVSRVSAPSLQLPQRVDEESVVQQVRKKRIECEGRGTCICMILYFGNIILVTMICIFLSPLPFPLLPLPSSFLPLLPPAPSPSCPPSSSITKHLWTSLELSHPKPLLLLVTSLISNTQHFSQDWLLLSTTSQREWPRSPPLSPPPHCAQHLQ